MYNAKSVSYNAKIDSLYKYIAEGWSVTLSESKAGLTHDSMYKRSEHFARVRRIAEGRTKKPTVPHRVSMVNYGQN